VNAVLDRALAPVAGPARRRWWALGALGLAGLAVGVDGTVLSVALPTLSRVLHASESDLRPARTQRRWRSSWPAGC
jgi:hypothetical protein